VKLQGFTDEDYAGSPSNVKRTLGNLHYWVSNSFLVNRKQRLVSLNSAEAEYMATN